MGIGKLLKRLRKPKDNFPHVCFYCRWFIKLEHMLNRGCQYPGDIKVSGGTYGVCLMWELEPDPEKRVRRFF